MTTNHTSANGKIPSNNGNSKIAATSQFQFLKPIKFQKVSFWDTKRYFAEEIKSKYPIENLGKFIIERREIVKPFQHPNETFAILGVSNKIGLFDAYEEKGSKIKQPYQKVENDFLAYNPYRINVGSIGLKTDSQKNKYISSAYIVFSCKNEIEPEFLYRLFETNRFNQVIRNTTAGSVRQNLSFNLLQEMQIPIPPPGIQRNLLAEYNSRVSQAEKFKEKVENLEKEIENHLLKELGIEIKRSKNRRWHNFRLLQPINLNELSRWDFNSLTKISLNPFYTEKFEMVKLTDYFELNPKMNFIQLPNTTTISFIPMENVSDEYGEIAELSEIPISKSKGYTKFQNDDLIWAKITPCMENGKSAVARNLKNGLGCGSTEFYVFRAKTNENCMIDFLYILGRTRYFRQIAEAFFTGSAGQQRVASTFFKDLDIPLPSETVRKKLVRKNMDIKAQIKKLKLDEENLRRQAKADFEAELFEI